MIKTYTELLINLKSRNYDILDFDYVEGKTKESSLERRPLIQIGKRFYENAYLWNILLEDNLQDLLDFIIDMKQFKINLPVMSSIITSKSNINDRYFNKAFDLLLNQCDEENKSIYIDHILVNTAQASKLDYFKHVVQYAKENNIEPKFETHYHSGNGLVLYYAVKNNNEQFVDYLLNNGLTADINDSMAYAEACKNANYYLAWKLASSGADIHTKHDLGLKMIIRNENSGDYQQLSDRDKSCKMQLFKRYKEDEEKQKEETVQTEN